MSQPFRHPKSGIYYLRRKVPDDLRACLGREFKRSLKTREACEAKANFAAAWAASEQAFALARAQTKGTEILSPQDVVQLAAGWFREEQLRLEGSGTFTDMLATDGSSAWKVGDRFETSKRYATLQDAAPELSDVGWREVVHSRVQSTLRRHNLPVPGKDTAAYVRLFAAFDAQIRKLSEWALQRHEGYQPGFAEPLPLQPMTIGGKDPESPGGGKRVLSTLFESYASEKILNDSDNRATRRSIDAYRAIVEGFIQLFGDPGAHNISRELVRDYRAALAKLPAKGAGTRGLTARQLIEKAEADRLPRLQEATIRNRLRALSAVLSHGTRIGWLPENPIIEGGIGRQAAKAATQRQAKARKRKEYSAEELRAIFTSPAFTDSKWSPPRAEFGRAWYWLPLLMYYTGARREELAQLQVSDVAKSADGIWHLSILASEDGQDGERTVKTAGSRRVVPLHPDLLARGLIDYRQSLPAGGRFFPGLKANPAGYFGANFGKRWASYLREVVKLNSPANPSHGFRHTFKTLSRAVGIPEDVHDAITGHSEGRGTARAYGTMPLERMAQQIELIPPAPSK